MVNRFFLLREAVTFYKGICPNPTSEEYTAMAKTLCHEYPELKDKGGLMCMYVICDHVIYCPMSLILCIGVSKSTSARDIGIAGDT